MKRISSLAALLAFLALGALLTFTHSESAGQTQPAQKEEPNVKELLKKIEAMKAEHADAVTKFERKVAVLNVDLIVCRGNESRFREERAQLHAEIDVLQKLPKVTATPAERAKVLEQLRIRLDKIDHELDELYALIGPPLLHPDTFEEKKEDGEPAKNGRQPLDKKVLDLRRRNTALYWERRRTMNFLLDALAVGLVTDQNAGIMMMLKTVIETKGLQEKVKLKTALEYFSDQFNGKLPILVDDSAFNPQNDTDVPSLYEEEVSLPPVPRAMPMSLALRIILSQVGKGEATYQIRQGHIEITTLKNATAASTLTNATVTASFDLRPLHEVLDALTEQSGLDINVDPAVGKKAATPIKATFRNTTLEEALVTATEMAELKYVVLDRTVYVTTPEKATVLRQEQKERDQRREKMRPVNPGGRKRGELPA